MIFFLVFWLSIPLYKKYSTLQWVEQLRKAKKWNQTTKSHDYIPHILKKWMNSVKQLIMILLPSQYELFDKILCEANRFGQVDICLTDSNKNQNKVYSTCLFKKIEMRICFVKERRILLKRDSYDNNNWIHIQIMTRFHFINLWKSQIPKTATWTVAVTGQIVDSLKSTKI